jgi:cytochrome b561
MSQVRYSTGAIILHWLIAVAVIVNWRIAAAAEDLQPAEQSAIMANHKALGITILILTLLRLAWRFAKSPPSMASTLKPLEIKLAKAMHAIFYVLLIGLPLGGWLANSFFGQGVNVFGIFTLPALPVGKHPDAGEGIFEVHANLGTAMLVLIALHVLGALKHQFLDKDGNLYRMLPFGTPKP